MADDLRTPQSLIGGDESKAKYFDIINRKVNSLETTSGTTSSSTSSLDTRVTALENAAPELFTSPDQPIVASTTLTIPHGLSSTPTKLWAFIVAQNPVQNYSVGDLVAVATTSTFYYNATGFMLGFNVIPDATNLTVIFAPGSSTSCFLTINKTTYAAFLTTNSDWLLRIIAAP